MSLENLAVCLQGLGIINLVSVSSMETLAMPLGENEETPFMSLREWSLIRPVGLPGRTE